MADEITTLVAVQPQMPMTTKRQSVIGDMWCVVKKTTLVAGSGSYTSEFVEVRKFKHIVGTCLFNENGTLTINQSNDGVTTDYTTTINTVGGTIDAFDIELVCPFVSLTWANGTANDTTTHRLFSYVKVF